DLVNFAAFDSNVNNVRLFEDPVTNRFAGSGLKAGAGILVDKGLRTLAQWRAGPIGFDVQAGASLPGHKSLMLTAQELAEARAGLSTVNPKYLPWDSGLKPGTMMTIPFAIDAGMLAVDTYGPDPSTSNTNFLVDRGLRAATIGAGVGVPIGLQTKDWKSFAAATTVPAGQYLASQWIFSKPPDPSANWYDLGGARAGVISGVNAIGDLDYYVRAGEGPGDGNTSNLIKAVVNPVVGSVAAVGDASLRSMDPVRAVQDLWRPMESHSPMVSEGVAEFAGRSFTRAQNGLYYAIHEVPTGPVDTATAVTLNGLQTVGRGLTLDLEGASWSWRRTRLDSTAYGTEPERE
ncbi:MAG: hypothetical protein ACRCYU_14060, partial [Nocardioides sp.]